MNRKHISTYYDEIDDEGFLLLGSRFMRAIEGQKRKTIGKIHSKHFEDQSWHKRVQETYRDRS